MKNVDDCKAAGIRDCAQIRSREPIPLTGSEQINTKSRKLTWDISVSHVCNFTFSNNHVFQVKIIEIFFKNEFYLRQYVQI